MKKSYILLCLMLGLTACERDIDLEGYRQSEGADLLALNAIIQPDSTVSATASLPYFFSDAASGPRRVDSLHISVLADGNAVATLRYNAARGRYESDYRPQAGSVITLRTTYKGHTVEATDTVPRPVRIESIRVERTGPVHVYYENDWILTYRITFTDPPESGNYYFLAYDPLLQRALMGERDYSQEYVFQQLARQINTSLPGWEPYSSRGLPFSDQGINGQRHTLVVREILQRSPGSSLPTDEELQRRFRLFSITSGYYRYLVSTISNQSDDSGLHGGLIDMGLTEPLKIYSNVSGGTGIVAGCSLSEQVVDVAAAVGSFYP